MAPNYRLSVTRIFGKPMSLMDEDVTDPFAALALAKAHPALARGQMQVMFDLQDKHGALPRPNAGPGARTGYYRICSGTAGAATASWPCRAGVIGARRRATA